MANTVIVSILESTTPNVFNNNFSTLVTCRKLAAAYTIDMDKHS